MRRLSPLFLLLAIAVAVAIALPAGAVKPDKPPRPSKSAPIAVSLEGSPMWVHEAGDVISYSVTVENKTDAAVTVEIVWEDEYEVSITFASITVDAKSAKTEKIPIDRRVNEDDIDNCLNTEMCDLFAEVTVQYPDGGDLIATVEASTLVDPVDECVLIKDKPVFVEAGLCIWKPGPTETGLWTISMDPDMDPNPEVVVVPTRPTNMMMTMRDGVPGNWCALEGDGGGGIVQERWLPKNPAPVVLNVYLPGEDGAMGDGVCVLGGHGVCTDDDCYFAVGNPESFYLYTTFDGFITPTITPPKTAE